MLFLLIVSNDFLQAQLENSDWVSKLLLQTANGCLFPGSRPLGLIKSLVVKFNGLITLFKTLLELLDF